MRIAVVTPYFEEPLDVLRRCHDSVRNQSVPLIHYMVSDGRPRPEIDDWDVRHITLPENVGGDGSTPRGIGSILAFAEGMDAVSFLDADNTVYREHGAEIEKALQDDPEFIYTVRRIFFPDGDELYWNLGNTIIDDKIVDTNCYVFTKRAAYLSLTFAMYPKQMGAGGDSTIPHVVTQLKLKRAVATRPTVKYLTHWLQHYLRGGKKPLLKMRKPALLIQDAWNEETFRQATGLRLRRLFDETAGPPAPVDPKNPKVTVITQADRCSAEMVAAHAGLVEELGDNFSHLVFGRSPAVDAGPRRVVFPFASENDQPPALNESVSAVYAFQQGADVIVLLSGDIEADEIRASVAKAISSGNSKDKRRLPPFGQRDLQTIPDSEPLHGAAISRTMAGLFIQRNLGRGVTGFGGRGWRKMLKY